MEVQRTRKAQLYSNVLGPGGGGNTLLPHKIILFAEKMKFVRNTKGGALRAGSEASLTIEKSVNHLGRGGGSVHPNFMNPNFISKKIGTLTQTKIGGSRYAPSPARIGPRLTGLRTQK